MVFHALSLGPRRRRKGVKRVNICARTSTGGTSAFLCASYTYLCAAFESSRGTFTTLEAVAVAAAAAAAPALGVKGR